MNINLNHIKNRVSSFKTLQLDPKKFKLSLGIKDSVPHVKTREDHRIEMIREINSFHKKYQLA